MYGYTAHTGTSRNLMVVHSVGHRSVSDVTNEKRRSVKMMENLSRYHQRDFNILLARSAGRETESIFIPIFDATRDSFFASV
jgi:hypothetical protein